MKAKQSHGWNRKSHGICFLLVALLLPELCSATVFPPSITGQPANQLAALHQAATFQVSVTGTTPLYFQWRKNGTNIPGANTSIYTITNVQASDQASYSVVVTNLVNPPATSSNASLTIFNSTISVDNISGTSTNGTKLAWSHTVGSGNNRLLLVTTAYRNANNTVTGVSYGGTPLAKVGSTNSPAKENGCSLWMLLAPTPGTATVVVTLSAPMDAVTGATSFAGVNQTTPLGVLAVNSDKDTKNGPATVTASSNPSELAVAVLATDGDAVSAVAASGQAALWNRQTGTAGGNIIGAAGLAAGAANTSLTWTLGVSKPWSLCAAAIKPVPNNPPVANAQAIRTTANSAKGITLTGSDADNDPLTFSILTGPGNGTLNGLNPTNGTVTYTPNTNFSGADNFTFRVNDGTTNSTAATVAITVTAVAPVIATPPQNQNLSAGQTTTINVAATGTGPLWFQWQFAGTNLVGATNAWLTLSNAQLNQSGSYTVVVTNSAGSMASSATLIVTNPVIVLSASGGVGMGMTPQGFGFQLSLPAGCIYVVSASTDLQNWTPIATNNSLTGLDLFTDPTATNSALRFYRASVP